jgi:hypothetical protein
VFAVGGAGSRSTVTARMIPPPAMAAETPNARRVAAGQRRRCGLPAGEEDVRARRGERGQDGEAECAPKLCSGGFTDFGVRRVVAETLAGNLGSRRVLEKSGLIQVDAFPGGGPDAADRTGQGHVVYELTRAGWEARHRTVS